VQNTLEHPTDTVRVASCVSVLVQTKQSCAARAEFPKPFYLPSASRLGCKGSGHTIVRAYDRRMNTFYLVDCVILIIVLLCKDRVDEKYVTLV
jgi:hypothetical protein